MFNGILFQDSLQDLVKGIRAHRRDEEKYVRGKVAEIGEECRSSDIPTKATAVQKLTLLQMMGHSVAFASFHIVEVMSSSDFASKRIGYLAAAQSFSPTTDVLLLTTNQFKKDLTNGKMQDCSQALTCLGKLVTEELGRDLEHDVSLLLNSPRPYIRKKALLVLYRLIMVHPDTLPAVSARFRERLGDSDPSVVCAAVTVTCELARASPRTFLSLAPVFYQLLMNKDSNNWMLIKIVKLMGVLTPLEPRLGKKLVEPLTSLMRATRAKSLLYECCSTVTAGLMAHPEAVELCAQRLVEFMDDSDQNLKYLGLLSMRKLIQAHPQFAQEHRDNILDCLDDEDIGIRMRALELVSEFVTSRTLRDISRILIRKLRKASADNFVGPDAFGGDATGDSVDFSTSCSSLSDQQASYREALARQLLKAGEFKRPSSESKGGYEMLTTGDDFAWYTTTILGGLAEIPLLTTQVRDTIGDQLLELTSRVEALRSISIKVAHSLLSLRIDRKTRQTAVHKTDDEVQPTLEAQTAATEDEERDATSIKKENKVEGTQVIGAQDAILSANLAGSMAWILGEYADLIEDHADAAQALVSFPKRPLDAAAQTRLLTACVKIFAACSEQYAIKVYQLVRDYTESLTNNQFAEVQERAWFFKSLLSDFDAKDREALAPLFEGKLIPVDHRAQSRVPISDELDLDTPLLDTGSDSLYSYLLKAIGELEEDEETADEDADFFRDSIISDHGQSLSGMMNVLPDATLTGSLSEGSLSQAERAERNPYYLQGQRSTEIMQSTGKGKSGVGSEETQDGLSRFGYSGTTMTSKAAVVIQEDNPLGLDIHEDEGQQRLAKPSVSGEKLQAAFDGAFDVKKPVGQRKEGKRRKKKKKSKTAMKNGTAASENGEARTSKHVSNLIDLDGESTGQNGTPDDGSSSRPKHLADVLLM